MAYPPSAASFSGRREIYRDGLVLESEAIPILVERVTYFGWCANFRISVKICGTPQRYRERQIQGTTLFCFYEKVFLTRIAKNRRPDPRVIQGLPEALYLCLDRYVSRTAA